jgi:predicted Zn-dependent protease
MSRQFELCLLILLPVAGCAGWRPQLPASGIASVREARKTEAMQAFEQQRDSAQLEAALDRWAAGDLSGCESRLRALLARHPENTDVRLHLAELLWQREALPEAENELRQIISAQPQRAESQHLLGLLLAEQDRVEEARSHLARAAELDPAGEDYRLALDALPARR